MFPRPLALALLGLALLTGGCDRQSAAPPQPEASETIPGGAEALGGVIDRSHKGSTMPDLVFADAAGQQLRLSTLKGKPLLINIWATWCGPCVLEMPMLDRLASEKSASLKVLTISQDSTQPEKVAAFFTDRKLTHLEAWLDPENQLIDHYKADTLPTTIYYDAQGREVWRFVGGHDWGSAETAKMLAEGV